MGRASRGKRIRSWEDVAWSHVPMLVRLPPVYVPAFSAGLIAGRQGAACVPPGYGSESLEDMWKDGYHLGKAGRRDVTIVADPLLVA